jgi:hypothetical protein
MVFVPAQVREVPDPRVRSHHVAIALRARGD